MMLEAYGTATVIGKNEEKGILGSKYLVAYESTIDGQRVKGTKRVNFAEYCGLSVGAVTNVRVFSGNGRDVTPSRIDAGLESIFGAFVHPSLRDGGLD